MKAPYRKALFLRLYAAVLRLYPAEYHRVFGDEMLWTVEQRLECERLQPAWRRAGLSLFELQGGLTGALRERLANLAVGREGSLMKLNTVGAGAGGANRLEPPAMSPESVKRGSSWQVAWPHLIFALFVIFTEASVMLPNVLPEGWSSAAGIVGGIAVLGILLVSAWRARRAGWSLENASLGGYLLVAAALVYLAAAQIVAPPLRWRLFSWNLVAGVPLMIMLALLWVSRTVPRQAALMAVPVALIFWQPTLEFTSQPARALAFSAVFVLAGLAAAWMVRLPRSEYAAASGVGLSMLIGVVITYARAFHHTSIPELQGEPAMEVMLEYLFPQAAALGVFFALPPVLSYLLSGAGRRFNPGALLAVLGLLGQYLGYSLSFFWHMEMSTSWVFAPEMPNPAARVFVALVYVSSGLYLLGVGWLYWRGRSNRTTRGWLWWMAAALLPAMLVMAAAALFYGMVWNPQALPVWMGWMPVVTPYGRMGISLVWMAAVAGVLVGIGRKST
jgi:hypothetical protein